MKFPKLKGKDWVMVAIIVAALALGWYAFSRSREGFAGATMTGEWITNKGQPVQKEITLPSGTKVYAVQESEYVKMASGDGKSRNYVGSISDFGPAKWDAGNVVPDGVYKVVLPAAAPAPAPAAAPAPAPVPEPTSGIYSANCARCQVINNQISCACEVAPK